MCRGFDGGQKLRKKWRFFRANDEYTIYTRGFILHFKKNNNYYVLLFKKGWKYNKKKKKGYISQWSHSMGRKNCQLINLWRKKSKKKMQTFLGYCFFQSFMYSIFSPARLHSCDQVGTLYISASSIRKVPLSLTQMSSIRDAIFWIQRFTIVKETFYCLKHLQQFHQSHLGCSLFTCYLYKSVTLKSLILKGSENN